MGSYITGLGLAIQGYDLHENGPWNFSFGNDGDINWNVTYGNMPSADYILAARHTSMVIGALTCLCVYLIVTLLSNWIGGLIAGLFMGVHPLSVYLFTLGVSDAAFTFVVALSVLAAIWLARRPTWGRAILLGIVLGIGTSLKLSPIFVAIGLAAIGVGILAGSRLTRFGRFGGSGTGLARMIGRSGRLGWMLIAIAADFGDLLRRLVSISRGPIRSVGQTTCSSSGARRWKTRAGSGAMPRSQDGSRC